MYRYLCIAFIVCAKAIGQSPASIEVHLKLDKSGQFATYSIVLNSIPEGEHQLNYAKDVRLLSEQAFQQNLPYRADCSKGKRVAAFRVSEPVDNWKFSFRYELKGSGMRPPYSGVIIGENVDWPIVFPENWKCPVLLSVESNYRDLRIVWPEDAELIVDGNDGYRSWFFQETKPVTVNSITLEIGAAQTIAVANRTAEINVPKAESTEKKITNIIPDFQRPPSIASDEEKQSYAIQVEDYWLKSGKHLCPDLLSDTHKLIGKKRDKELFDLEKQLVEGRINPLSFLNELDKWRYKGFRNWSLAFSSEQAQEQNRSLQFNFNRRSVYADITGKFDPLGDTNSIDVRLKRWYLGSFDNDSLERLKCSLLDDEIEGFEENNPWFSLIEKGIRPVINLSYRYKRSEGKLYVYAEQLQDTPLDFQATIETHSLKEMERFNLQFSGKRDTMVIPIQSSLRYAVVDPEYQVPIFWQEEKSDLQLLMEFQETQEKSRRFEVLDALLQTENTNLRRTAIGIGLRDEWKEVRIMSILSCADISQVDWEFMKPEINKLAKEDSDADVRSYAEDLLLER